MSTLTALDWPRLLATPMTRWYLDRESWDTGQCVWQEGCPGAVVAYVEYRVAGLPYDPHDTGFDAADLVCSKHLPDMIAHALEEPLVADTVVEVGVDPAYLRLTGVDPAFVEAEFNNHAMGVSA
jgi:hypothetical protein